MNNADHAEKLLRHWGEVYGQFDPRYDFDEGEPPLHLASQLGPHAVDRTREGDAHVLQPAQVRANMARRLIQRMGKDEGSEGRVPTWAGGDPIRGKESRSSLRTTPWYPDPVAEQVDGWVLQLGRLDPRAAMALRVEYQMPRAPLKRKVLCVAYTTETRVTRTGYRAAVARGKLYIARTLEAQLKIAS